VKGLYESDILIASIGYISILISVVLNQMMLYRSKKCGIISEISSFESNMQDKHGMSKPEDCTIKPNIVRDVLLKLDKIPDSYYQPKSRGVNWQSPHVNYIMNDSSKSAHRRSFGTRDLAVTSNWFDVQENAEDKQKDKNGKGIENLDDFTKMYG
jgi:hypothetical protein